MKTPLLLAAILLLFSVFAFTQERPRYYENFDTQRGVQVQSDQPAQMSVNRQPVAKRGAAARANPYLPSPPYGDKYKNMVDTGPAERVLIRPTGQVTMRVNDDYYTRATYNPAEAARLKMGTGTHLKGYSTGDDLVDAYIVDSSRRYDIDPLLIYSQMGQESSFKPRATSNKGASGLMQLMPATARRLGVTNIYDPQQNIEGGVKYMRMLLDMFSGDVNLALAGYNAGEAAVMKYGYQIPPYAETQDYVRRISARYRSISNATIASNNVR